MSASMIGFSLNDALIKTLADDLPLYQAVFLRGIFASIFVGGLAWGQGALRFRPGRRDRRLVGQRAFAEILGTACFLTALFNMPIANATAILQSVPLAVTLGAAAFLGEKVGWRRYAAILVGLLGVFVIVRPGSEGFTPYALLVVATVVLVVLRDLSTRALSPDAPATWVVTVTSVAMTVAFGLAAAATEWRPVEPGHLLVLAAGAAALQVGYVFGVVSMRTGEIGFTQPFRYTLILWAILLGILLFDEWPDAWTLAGAAIIVGAGIFTLRRDRLGSEGRLLGTSGAEAD
ncbi:MAG: DMT family transporter [Amaricoccus sp.]|nr:DMT family transporter [Amaricoccus sp.]